MFEKNKLFRIKCLYFDCRKKDNSSDSSYWGWIVWITKLKEYLPSMKLYARLFELHWERLNIWKSWIIEATRKIIITQSGALPASYMLTSVGWVLLQGCGAYLYIPDEARMSMNMNQASKFITHFLHWFNVFNVRLVAGNTRGTNNNNVNLLFVSYKYNMQHYLEELESHLYWQILYLMSLWLWRTISLLEYVKNF